MKGISSKAKVTLGLVGLVASVLLLAAMLELVPDPVVAARNARAMMAEVLASSSSSWVSADDRARAEETLRLAVERNPELLSAALRRRDGTVVVQVGEHVGLWRPMTGEHSSDTQIRVPILTGERRWGQLELRYEPLLGTGPLAPLRHPLAVLVAFVVVTSFFSFYFYLSKALAQLDPGKAVPGRVRSALDTMAEGLLVIDRGGRVVLANRAFAALVGRAPETLVGVQPADLPFLHPAGEGAAAPRFPWIRALETGEEEYGVSMRLRGGDGVERALMVNCSPVLAASGRPGGVLVSFDDVTELEARGEALREAKNAADQANRAKSEFLANMSHEIRTPMNAILGFTDVLRRQGYRDPEEARRHLDVIHRSGTHLLDLINDILDLSKVESGGLEVECIPVAPHEVVRDALTVLDVKAREKGIDLVYEPIGPTPETVRSDPARLRQIVTNLVGNAIKFTDEGEVRVTTRLVDAASGPELEISVRDTGIGIPADKIDTVFEAFAQADASVTRRFGGTGLGLPISRRFARALGGDITVASESGAGSTFTARIATGPLDGVRLLDEDEVRAAAEEVRDVETRAWSFPGARVLIVDDAPENRTLLEIVLGESGAVVRHAGNGEEALEVAAREPLDLILMDMQMPVMDGYTATRRLRERGVRVPVIALTAHAMQGYEQECRAAGCDDFVTKPIDIDVLLESIARWLPSEVRIEDRAAPERPGAVVAPLGGPGTAGRGARAAPEDAAPAGRAASPVVSALAGSPRMHRVIRLFAERLAGRLDAMGEGDDLAALAEMAHWLKGSAGTVGYGDFTEPAAELEQRARAGDGEGARALLAEVRSLAARLEVPAGESAAPRKAAAGSVDSLGVKARRAGDPVALAAGDE